RVLGPVLVDDGQAHARGTQVLLGAGVDQVKLGDINGTRQDLRRHVRDERYLAGVRKPLVVLGPEDRVVGADVDVTRVRVELGGGVVRDVGKVLIFARRDDVALGDALGFFDRLLGPGPGVDEVD